MAVKEQQDILRQGATKWDAWRKQNREVPIDLSGADLYGANLSGAYLYGATLSGANLSGANLSGADLYGANLSGATFSYATLTNATFSYATLTNATFSYATLSGADLTRATLSYATFRYATLTRANLYGAYLYGADLSGADLSGADLSGARISQTIFNDLDLRSVKGLETIQHDGPSGITTSTLERSQGDIPDRFLKGAGLSNTFISYARSLVQSPLQYYTCFISYSSQNQDFVERLYADLQHKGIRCWYASEDLKIGDHFPERIEEAIRFYDKLIVILSEQSMTSSWVEDEVRAAQEKEERFKQEQQVNKTVLFPITIDQAIDQATAQWAARLRRQRHIGKFTNWKEHDHYQKAFQRLLRDLQQVPTKDEQHQDKTP